MIIDTEKLRELIDHADDEIDWEHCPISQLERAEARALKRISIIEAIENIQKELIHD